MKKSILILLLICIKFSYGQTNYHAKNIFYSKCKDYFTLYKEASDVVGGGYYIVGEYKDSFSIGNLSIRFKTPVPKSISDLICPLVAVPETNFCHVAVNLFAAASNPCKKIWYLWVAKPAESCSIANALVTWPQFCISVRNCGTWRIKICYLYDHII